MNQEKPRILQDEIKSHKTKLFAKFLDVNNEKYTLGMMGVIIGYIYKSTGTTLQNSNLLKEFRRHVISIVNSDFLSKININLLLSLTNKYRNKAAHTEVITLEEANLFTKDIIELLKSLLSSFEK